MKLRPWIGVLLVVLSVAAMYIWETRLRSKVELRTVLVYSRDVEAGEEMAPDHFKLISTTPESVVPGGLSPEEVQSVYGLAASAFFHENQQVLADHFSPKALAPPGTCSFPIASSWIAAVSRLNEAGDMVRIYLVETGECLGSYRVRALPTGGADLEIACRLEDYLLIRSAALQRGPGSLIVANEAYK